jgi:hypothetical protein
VTARYVSLTFTGDTLSAFSIWSPGKVLNSGKPLVSAIIETGRTSILPNSRDLSPGCDTGCQIRKTKRAPDLSVAPLFACKKEIARVEPRIRSYFCC